MTAALVYVAVLALPLALGQGTAPPTAGTSERANRAADVLTDAQKTCCATAESVTLTSGSKYSSPYASGHMKADGSCGEIAAPGVVTDPWTRYGSVVQCRTIGMYQEDPWADPGCQMACGACTACDLTLDAATQDPANGVTIVDPHPCGVKMSEFDALQVCKPNDAGWANIDMDSLTGGYEQIKDDADVATKISLTYATKASHTDVEVDLQHPAGRKTHGGTVGSFTYQSLNKRYFLPCKQTSDQKTIKVTVTRPADLTEFGGEWIKSYPKDSWINETNEYEPYTFNDFGSKIPLDEFRPVSVVTHSDNTQQKLEDDANATTQLNVFMEMSKDGDYELRYGNPQLAVPGYTDTGDRWVAVEFKKSQLRVGSPWSICTGGAAAGIDSADYDGVGTIVPMYLGNPSLLIHDYKAVHTELSAAFAANKAVPTKIILNIYTPTADSTSQTYTSGAKTTGWTDGDKSYTTMHCDSSWQLGDPVEAPSCQERTYEECYSAGEACPLGHSVCKVEYCELQRWREIIKLYKQMPNVQVLGLIETKSLDADGKPTISRGDTAIKADIADYLAHVGGADGIDGFYFNEAHGSKADVDDLMEIAKDHTSKFVVFGHGEPLFDLTAPNHAGAPDVWVTLHETTGKLGFWTPFSWFPKGETGLGQDKWGAMVYNVDELDVVETLEVLFDRGYGYVYLHSENDYATISTHLTKLVEEISVVSNSRRLLDTVASERKLQSDDGLTRRTWGCDETLLQCRPVCLETSGVVTTIVQNKMCGDPAEDMDECSCPCYYDAYWACAADGVVCMATRSGQSEPAVVGDLVCQTRGTPKPVVTAAQRQAGACPAKTPTQMGAPPAPICSAAAEMRAANKESKEAAAAFGDLKWDLTNDDLLASSVSIALAAIVMGLVA
jgi:hypothetical protein